MTIGLRLHALAGLTLSALGGAVLAAVGASASSWGDPQVVIGLIGAFTGLVVAVTALLRTFRSNSPRHRK